MIGLTIPGSMKMAASFSPCQPIFVTCERGSLPRGGECRSRVSATNSGVGRNPDDYNATVEALKSKGRRPRKALGQHYMLNMDVNKQLSRAANVEEGDVVLEIGPGTGSLTNVLINDGAAVLAIEKDPHMAAIVNERFTKTGRFKVVQEDFVRCNIQNHLQSLQQAICSSGGISRKAKVVANIPFNISTEVIKQLLPMGCIFSQVALLVQDETALRLVDSSPGSSEYRSINVFVNFYSEPEYRFHVPKSFFFPQPSVDAAVMTFKIKQAEEYPAVSSAKSFFSMVNSAFNGKRKMLRRSLQHLCSSGEIEEALSDLGLPVTSRPEELTLDDFVNLHNAIVKS